MSDTKERLQAAALEVLRTKGLAGTTARSIAAQAGVNQALVFYHFGTVDEIVDQACLAGTTAMVAGYRKQLSGASTLRSLLDVGRSLHEIERSSGNVAVLAQVMAGAQRDNALAVTARESLSLWVQEIELSLERLLHGSPLAGVTDVAGLARGLTAAFIGLELYDGVDPGGAEAAFVALEQLAVLVEVVDDLGPVARRALRSRLRRVGAKSHGGRSHD